MKKWKTVVSERRAYHIHRDFKALDKQMPRFRRIRREYWGFLGELVETLAKYLYVGIMSDSFKRLPATAVLIYLAQATTSIGI